MDYTDTDIPPSPENENPVNEVQEAPKTNPWKWIAIISTLIIILAIIIAVILTIMFLKKGETAEKPIIERPNFPNISQLLQSPVPSNSGNQTSNNTQNQTANLTMANQTNTTNITLENITIEIDYIDYLLNEIGAYMLHPPPFSSNLPVIEFKVDEEYFTSIVEEGIIYTEKRKVNEEDLRFFTDKLEILEIMTANNITERFIESLQSGKTGYEMVAGEQELLLKGYVTLYERITGEEVSLTGSVIRAFFF